MTAVGSQPYHTAVFAIVEEQAAHAARFADSRRAYNRFYDLAAHIGADKAKESLPEEAQIVAELEASTPDRNKQMEMVTEALVLSLEMEMRSIAEASVMSEGSIIGRLRSDILELGRYRKKCLDGVDGRFWDVVKQGDGATRKESGRMINRILSAWCDVYEIAPGTMVEAATIINTVPDAVLSGIPWDITSKVIAERWRDYPFNLEDDLTEVKAWGEKDPEAVDALLSFCGQLNIPEQGSSL